MEYKITRAPTDDELMHYWDPSFKSVVSDEINKILDQY